MNKISIIGGAGRVGETTALVIAEQGLCREVALLDVGEGAAEGAARDIQQSASFFRFDVQIHGGHEPSIIGDSDLVIVTAGSPRKPGMSRGDVLQTNRAVIDGVIEQVLRHAPTALLLLVTNPVDALTWHAWKQTGWNRSRVFGQGGVLDASRMANAITEETGLSSRDIQTLVIGGHNDSMVPLFRFSCISGIPVRKFLDDAAIERVTEHTRNGGAEVLALRKTSSAYNAPAAAIATMVDAISHDRKRILPCVCVLDGEYGERDATAGVPAVLGRQGVERIVELELNETEMSAFRRSIGGIRAAIELLQRGNG
jgi:malate dehydrogenase